MKKICENIYKTSRKNAGLEQIEAAEKLGVSTRSLQVYESDLDSTVPQLDVLRNMCILYRDPGLAMRHLKKSPIADFLPDYEQQPLGLATLSFLDDLKKVSDISSTLINITRDGKIDDAEKTDWNEIMLLMSRLMTSITSLKNSQIGGE